MDDEGSTSCCAADFPDVTDVLVEILLRLPPNSRRRFRLVCRQWREAVDERTATDVRSRAKTLLASGGDAYLLDDNLTIKKVMTSPEDRVMEVVGTCNGLICLCDDSNPGGAVALANPANGERLVLPPLPCADSKLGGAVTLANGESLVLPPLPCAPRVDIFASDRLAWHKAYGFAHHERTGRYKVAHVPCGFERVWEFHTVQVFTLGEASWRDVATSMVDGATPWVAEGTERIMSFNLDDEHVTSVNPLPVPLPDRTGGRFRLAEVLGRPGIAIAHGSPARATTDVWVLESARREKRWRRWYRVEMNVWPTQLLLLPHFAHNEHLALTRTPSWFTRGDGSLYTHEHNGAGNGIVRICWRNRGTEVARGYFVEAFAYVKSKEPLNAYRVW